MKAHIITLTFLALLFASCGQSSSKSSDENIATVTPVEITYEIEGMMCTDCEESIKKGVNSLEGISSVDADFEESNTHIIYDPSKTSEEEIITAIENRGYTVVQ